MIDFTLITAVDKYHLDELLKVWPTWIGYKKEILNCPVSIIYDVNEIKDEEISKIKHFLSDNKYLSFIPWEAEENKYKNQREKMLTALTLLPSRHIKTEWFLKIDTDTYATNDKEWIQDDWFQNDICFVTNKWRYTKPANALEILDNWADNVDVLKERPRLNIPYNPEWSRVCHRRIISWLFFCRTGWSKNAVSFIENKKLPIPSQDTFLWYIATRLGYKYKTVGFKNLGWQHSNKNIRKWEIKQ